ncbi:MAG: hypothetical protein PHN75_03110 [Syntrophales bacterium]|nr:hypothetical protein [Syntrophales bacterium]
MKKILVVMLALGIFMAFALPAAASDVKFSGSYYIQGSYVDNPSLLDPKTQSSVGTGATGSDPSWGRNSYNSGDYRNNRGAYSGYVQRLRMETELKIVEGLSLKTRFDALEKQWGGTSWGAGDTFSRPSTGSSAALVQENIEFEEVFADFKTGIGQFAVGYQPMTNFGTNFLYTAGSDAGIRWQFDQGNATVFAKLTKKKSAYNVYANATVTNGVANDADIDVYELGGIGRFGGGEAGMMIQYWRDAANRRSYSAGTYMVDGGNGYQGQTWMMNPYTKLKLGNNLYVEAEGYYKFGTFRKYEDWGASSSQSDVQLSSYAAYVQARYDFKPAYAGLKFVMISGDDMNSRDKITGSTAAYYRENFGFQDSLILFNHLYLASVQPLAGNIQSGTTAGYVNPRTGQSYAVGPYGLDNVWMYQGYIGMKPTSKLNLRASLLYANADKKPKLCVGGVGDTCSSTTGGSGVSGQTNKEFVGGNYGTELDVTATYSIYDNLTYTIGAGYLWTGDYFKGYDADAKIKDNYMLMHNLTLAF